MSAGWRSPRPRRGIARCLAMLGQAGAMVCCIGCAVLTVEVDVYRGPLANERQTQFEQVAGLAMAAKPLLVELRDRLEVRDADCRARWRRGEPDLKGRTGHPLPPYCAGAIYPTSTEAPPPAAEGSTTKAPPESLCDDSAIKANAVLTLYDDLASEFPAKLLDRMVETANRIQDELRSIEVTPEVQRQHEGKLRQPHYLTPHALAQTAAEAERGAVQARFDALRKALEAAYIRRTNSPSATAGDAAALPKAIRDLFEAPTELSADERQVLEDALEVWGGLPLERGSTDSIDVSRVIARGRVADELVQLAWPDVHERERTLIADDIREGARAYLNAAAATSELLVLSCEFINAVASQQPSPSREQALRVAADLVVSLVNVRELRDSQESLMKGHEDLFSRIGLIVLDVPSLREVLRAELIEKPTETASALLHIHRRALLLPDITLNGIAVRPRLTTNSTDADGVAAEKIISEVCDLQRVVGVTTLGAGRLSQGLESLIQEYLAAVESAANRETRPSETVEADLLEEQDVDAAARKLESGLVNFAEKLLTLGNFSMLTGSSGRDSASVWHEPGGEFVNLLQTVGNTILTQVNELRAYRSWSTRADDPAALRREREIALHVYDIAASPSVRLEDFITDVRGAAQAEREEAAGHAVRSAQLTRIHTILQSAIIIEGATVDDILAAIAAGAADTVGAQEFSAELKDGIGGSPTGGDAFDAILAALAQADTISRRAADIKAVRDAVDKGSAGEAALVWTGWDALKAGFDADTALSASFTAVMELRLPGTAPIAPGLHDHAANKTGDTLKTAVTEWLGRAAVLARPELIAHMQKRATALKAFNPPDSAVAEDWWPHVLAHLSAIGIGDGERALLESRRTAWIDELRKEKRIAGALRALRDAIHAEIKEAERSQAASIALGSALAELAEVTAGSRQELLKSAEQRSGPNRLADVVVELVAARALLAAEGTPRRATLDAAHEEARLRSTALFLRAFTLPDETSKRIEVIESVITQLEFERILAMKGDQSATVAAIDEALRSARWYRASQIYLRPGSFYLRNSTPASSLQLSNAAGYRNELSRHAVGATPIWGEDMRNTQELDGSPYHFWGGWKATLKSQAHLDRVFWQNINTVRVAGGGSTNYAIVKDDIGNWYVKSYSTDVTEIVKAARSVALFSMTQSGAIPAGSLRATRGPRDPRQLGVADDDGPVPADASTRIDDAYAKSRFESYAGLAADAAQLPQKIGTAWKAIGPSGESGSSAALAEVRTQLTAAASFDGHKDMKDLSATAIDASDVARQRRELLDKGEQAPQDSAYDAIDAVRAVLRYRQRLLGDVARIVGGHTDPAIRAHEDAFAKAVDEAVLGIVDRHITAIVRSISAYQEVFAALSEEGG